MASARVRHAVDYQVKVPNKHRIREAARHSKSLSGEERTRVAHAVKLMRAKGGAKHARNQYGRRFVAGGYRHE